MDFSRPHIITAESVATKAKIRYVDPCTNVNESGEEAADKESIDLDARLVKAANRAAQDLLLGPSQDPDHDNPLDTRQINSALYPDRLTPLSETIQPGQLVVVFESFDNLNFVYATRNSVFCNRFGNFHHNDFIGQPFGCKIRSKNNRGYGFLFLLKPTPELWARSLTHRTQIVHELDAAMIVFYLNLTPNMVVCETGTGSGAMSHAIMRTIAPQGKLHTFEFNKVRADQARQEFAKNGLSHLVEVYHKDVCGKAPVGDDHGNNNNNSDGPDGGSTSNHSSEEDSNEASATTPGGQGGFGLQGQSVSAIFLDLPEPWLAIPHAAYTLKPNGRIASYSPCMEQTQRTCQAMREAGFHSLRTMEFRIRENYVDEVEYEMPPMEKRPRVETYTSLMTSATTTNAEAAEGEVGATAVPIVAGAVSGGEDTGAEEENEKSEMSETEADQLSLVQGKAVVAPAAVAAAGKVAVPHTTTTTTATGAAAVTAAATTTTTNNGGAKRKKLLVARPFNMMRGHTAFLTFATAGNLLQPDPNKDASSPPPSS